MECVWKLYNFYYLNTHYFQINLKLESGQTQFAGSQRQSMQNSFHKYYKAKLSIGITFPFIVSWIKYVKYILHTM